MRASSRSLSAETLGACFPFFSDNSKLLIPATLALVTDYDCWHEAHDAVTVETVIENLNKNVRNAQKIMLEAVRRLAGEERKCKCGQALRHAIMTPQNLWPEATTNKLDAIIKKYRAQANEQ